MKSYMIQNMGDGDRVIRVLIGALLIGYTMGTTVSPLGWLSLLPLLAIPVVMTAIIGWDPIYASFKLDTLEQLENLPSAVVIEGDFTAKEAVEESLDNTLGDIKELTVNTHSKVA